MTSPVSRSTLKISLLVLLGFTTFCLIVLEVTLNEQRLEASHQRYTLSRGRALQHAPASSLDKPSVEPATKRPSVGGKSALGSSDSSQHTHSDLQFSADSVFRIFSGVEPRDGNSSLRHMGGPVFGTTEAARPSAQQRHAARIATTPRATATEVQAVLRDSQSKPADSKSMPKESQAIPKDSQPILKDSQPIPVNSKSIPKGSLVVPKNSQTIPGESKPMPVESVATSVQSQPGSSLAAGQSKVIDYCQQSQQTQPPTLHKPFSLQAQTFPNGTRPSSCNGCFNTNFPALIENCGVCNTGEGNRSGVVEMVVVVLTTHRAADRRQAIRDTWASITRNNTATVRHVFLVGRVKDAGQMKRTQTEQARHGDIIMYDFMDSYANLTLKTLTAMHWATRFCSNATYLLKADDDMWVNIPNLLTLVRRENASLHTAVGGACRYKAQPIRSKGSKWYVSFKAYPHKTYPGFCSGTTYVTSLNVARHVISVSPHVPFFYLEDVYVSLCIQRLGPPFRLKALRGFFHGWADPCKLRSNETVTVHQVSPPRLRQIWKAKCGAVGDHRNSTLLGPT